jgi:alkylhydroperoxidase/carboxymuconolactone decarboxylase family protein YurZ
MTDITSIITKEELQLFKDAYTVDVMRTTLVARFKVMYPPSRPYVDAISTAFLGDRDDPEKLADNDLERCLIAVLASRGADVNLAIHIYAALALGVTPGEIGHILFLAGVYTGIDNFSESLMLLATTLGVLKGLADDPNGPRTPDEVVPELVKQLEP